MVSGLEDTFDFVTNESGDMMLLMFQSDGEPSSPHFEVEKDTNTLWLYRNVDNVLGLYDIEPHIILKLLKMKSLLVCEMSNPPVNEDSELLYAYEAKRL